MMEVLLPAQINADGLLPFVSQLTQGAQDPHIILDFSALRRVSPAGLVALVASVFLWKRNQRQVEFRGLDRCEITGYLQRMDLLKVCDLVRKESFVRHESKGRFVPIRQVEVEVDEMGHNMAACLAPGGEDYGHPMSGLYDIAWYILTETATNIRQHSRGKGFAAAQVTRREGMVRIALADNGKGILQSFRDAEISWSFDLDDAGAIRKAVESRVSSRGRPTNEGVGLTLVSNLAQLAKGYLLIVSGNGVFRTSPHRGVESSNLPGGGFYQGTLIGLTFPQDRVRDYAVLLHQAKVQAGLLHEGGKSGMFKP